MLTTRFSDLSDDQWLDILGDADARAAHGLPRLPPREIQEGFTGQSGRPAFEWGIKAWQVFWREANKRRQFDRDAKLLDLGCGWGRFTTLAMRHFAPDKITSADAEIMALNVCREAGMPTRLLHTRVEPPRIPVEDDSFDMAIAYSVFSHLREDYHLRLLEEMRRVLKPGGVLAVTTRARWFIGYMEQLRNEGGGKPAFVDRADAERRYDAGEFVFDCPITVGPLVEIYGEAAIPRAYVEREWAKLFKDVKYIPNDQTGDEQAIIIATK